MKPAPDVKLAYNPGPVDAYGAQRPIPEAPTIRLAHAPGAQGDNNLLDQPPTVRLATTITYGALSPEAFERHLVTRPELPALLVSYAYLEPFLKNQSRYSYRDWVLDSGAFSAHASGKPVDLARYIETCQRLLHEDSTLTEVYALDEIGSWSGSRANTEKMWAAGVPAIPCYHFGEPEDVLLGLARDYPKIAIGGAVGVKIREKNEWAGKCFSRVWPKRIHGFGFGSASSILTIPFHSVDATNWETGPCKFGRWAAFGVLSVRGSKQNLRSEIEHYLKIEADARFRWRKEMALLESVDAPVLRLANANANSTRMAVFEEGAES